MCYFYCTLQPKSGYLDNKLLLVEIKMKYFTTRSHFTTHPTLNSNSRKLFSLANRKLKFLFILTKNSIAEITFRKRSRRERNQKRHAFSEYHPLHLTRKSEKKIVYFLKRNGHFSTYGKCQQSVVDIPSQILQPLILKTVISRDHC